MAKLHKNEKKAKRKVEMWVARDENFRDLNLFTRKPEKNEVWGYFYETDGTKIPLPTELFLDVEYRNSPVKIDMSMEVWIPKEGY